MTTGMNLWDANVWSFIITMTLLFVSMIAANILRNTVTVLRRLMIPSSVLGGFLLLIVNTIAKNLFDFPLYETGILEILTYHGLGLGFAAMALRITEKNTAGRSRTGPFDTGIAVVCSYLLQAAVGLAVTIGLYYLIDSFYASGLLLPMGYGQGPGQAYTWGHNYEVNNGFQNGTSFGLAVSSMGFVSASVGGVVYLMSMRRKGRFSGEIGKNSTDDMTVESYAGKNEVPLAESMDKFTIQVSLTFFAYILAFLFMKGVNTLIEAGVFGGLGGTIQSMIWGFQFLFSTLFGLLIKLVIVKLRAKNVMKRDYINNFMMNRISGFMFDVMVVSSIAAIDLTAFLSPRFLVPLSIICVLGAVVTYLYLNIVCKRIFPLYRDESFLSLYGMLTGTASTGVILLREIDPQFKTQASDNLVYQQPWAILFGFPMFLLLGVAPQSPGKSIMTLGVCAALFLLLNVLLFRRSLKKKNNGKSQTAAPARCAVTAALRKRPQSRPVATGHTRPNTGQAGPHGGLPAPKNSPQTQMDPNACTNNRTSGSCFFSLVTILGVPCTAAPDERCPTAGCRGSLCRCRAAPAYGQSRAQGRIGPLR